MAITASKVPSSKGKAAASACRPMTDANGNGRHRSTASCTLPGERSESVRCRFCGKSFAAVAQNQPGPHPTSRTLSPGLRGSCHATHGNQPVSAIVYSLFSRARAASLRLSPYCSALPDVIELTRILHLSFSRNPVTTHGVHYRHPSSQTSEKPAGAHAPAARRWIRTTRSSSLASLRTRS